MYHSMNGGWGSGWLWLTVMIVFWLAVLGGVVYAAVRLAIRHESKPPVGS